MNKNAYEIRLDILSMAHSDMTNKFLEKLNSLRDIDNREYERHVRGQDNIGNYSEASPSPTVNMDKIEELFPKTSDIIRRAEELASFVNG